MHYKTASAGPRLTFPSWNRRLDGSVTPCCLSNTLISDNFFTLKVLRLLTGKWIYAVLALVCVGLLCQSMLPSEVEQAKTWIDLTISVKCSFEIQTNWFKVVTLPADVDISGSVVAVSLLLSQIHRLLLMGELCSLLKSKLYGASLKEV